MDLSLFQDLEALEFLVLLSFRRLDSRNALWLVSRLHRIGNHLETKPCLLFCVQVDNQRSNVHSLFVIHKKGSFNESFLLWFLRSVPIKTDWMKKKNRKIVCCTVDWRMKECVDRKRRDARAILISNGNLSNIGMVLLPYFEHWQYNVLLYLVSLFSS